MDELPHRELDLTTLDRIFVLRCHDTITAAIAPTLVSRVQAHAPGVRLRFLAETAADTSDLRQGRVDLEIGATQPDQPDIRFETLGEARLVVALRPGHPLLGARWTVEDYAAAQHVIVSRRGRLRDHPIDGVTGVDASALQRTVGSPRRRPGTARTPPTPVSRAPISSRETFAQASVGDQRCRHGLGLEWVTRVRTLTGGPASCSTGPCLRGGAGGPTPEGIMP